MKNLLSLKECNWKQCKRKDVTLKLCKKCLSVNYCSRICQKKDWSMSCNGSIAHKYVCKDLLEKDLKMTLKNDFGANGPIFC